MIGLGAARELHNALPSELVSDYGGYTTDRFKRGGLPTIIAARNEESDLPATLISLAANDWPTTPIVVENGSSDLTANYARKMGAIVLESPDAYKMAALQYGMRFVRDAYSKSNAVLFTDADTLVGRSWAWSMLASIDRHAQPWQPAAVLGGSVTWFGPSAAADIIRTSFCGAQDIVRRLRKTIPVCRGHNMALQFGNDTIYQEYQALDQRLFVGEELAIVDTILAHDGVAIRDLSNKSRVITKGDRYTTMRDCVYTLRHASRQERVLLYAEYGNDLIPYSSNRPLNQE